MKFLLVLALFVIASIPHTMATSYNVLIGTTQATLLSGSTLTACAGASVNTSGCSAGMAAVALVARRLAASTGITPTIYPYVDRQTAFVQMHPAGWSVNVPIMNRLGFSTCLAPPSLFTSTYHSNWGFFFNTTFYVTFANARVDPTNAFYGMRTLYSVQNRVAFIVFDINASPNTLSVADVADAVLADIQQRGIADFTVFYYTDPLTSPDTVLSTLGTIKPDVFLWGASSAASSYRNGNTLVLPVVVSSSTLHVLNLTYDSTASPSVSGSVTAVSLTITIGSGDAQYYSDQTYLANQGSLASVNNPLMGTSGVMPVHRSGSMRLCFAGECPGGRLFAEAVRYVHNTDIGFTSSGAFRGPGWAAGNFYTSDVWALNPFANQVCYGTLRGISIFQILNYSAAMTTAPSDQLTAAGDRLLQLAGVRMTFDPNATFTRLLSVSILNRNTGVYEALDRLKLYTFAADSYVTLSYSPYPTFIAGRYDGEVAPTCLTSSIFQTDVATYMAAVSSFNVTSQGTIVVSPMGGTASYMNWIQTQSSCSSGTYWQATTASCIDCPSGQTSAAGALSCHEKAVDNTTTIIAIAVPCGAVFLGLMLGFLVRSEIQRRKNVRNVDNAPKSGQVSLLFTDIQDSTKLWGACPASMSVSLDQHHALIRECIARHKGYEVKTVGDCFMIAVGDVDAAVSLACDIQYALQQQQFPKAISDVYQCEDEDQLDSIDDNPDNLAPLDPLFNGLRVRIGMHTGNPDVVFDEVTRGYDYYGPPVNVAARVESTARGGQINASRDLVNCLGERTDVEVIFMGAVELKGVSGLTEILHIVPKTLKGRVAVYQSLAKKDEDSKDESSNRDSDVQSMMSNAAVADTEIVKRFVLCFMAALKVMKPKDQTPILESFCKAWRVRIPKKDLSTEEMIKLFAGRASKGMKRSDAAFAGSFRGANMLGTSQLQQNPSQVMNSPQVDALLLPRGSVDKGVLYSGEKTPQSVSIPVPPAE